MNFALNFIDDVRRVSISQALLALPRAAYIVVTDHKALFLLLSLSRKMLPQSEVWQRYIRVQKIKFVFKYDLTLQHLKDFPFVSLNFGLTDISLNF